MAISGWPIIEHTPFTTYSPGYRYLLKRELIEVILMLQQCQLHRAIERTNINRQTKQLLVGRGKRIMIDPCAQVFRRYFNVWRATEVITVYFW